MQRSFSPPVARRLAAVGVYPNGLEHLRALSRAGWGSWGSGARRRNREHRDIGQMRAVGLGLHEAIDGASKLAGALDGPNADRGDRPPEFCYPSQVPTAEEASACFPFIKHTGP